MMSHASSQVMRGIRRSFKRWRGKSEDSNSPYLKRVPLDRLLCGGEQKLSAAQYARHTGNFLRPSTPVSLSPHVNFLREYQLIGGEIFRPQVLAETQYFKHAAECIDTVGEYLTCTYEDQLERVARQFAALYSNEQIEDERLAKTYFRPPNSIVYVRPIAYSDCYEVVDGMNQLAIACVRGERDYLVYVMPPAVLTPLQQLLLDSAFCRGNRELYQPVKSPELGREWKTIRRCEDRFALMEAFLKEQNLLPPVTLSYLDLAFSYGWFVRAFNQLGFEAYGGGEIDWASCEVGRKVYGLEQEQLVRSELVKFLQADRRSYDVVSCLSIVHHFLLGLPYRASIPAEALIRLVDEKTRTLLFFDMGQEHEAWFKEKLKGWNAEHVEEWLRANTSFKKIFRLGTDQDNVPPFEDCYGRTLFACLR